VRFEDYSCRYGAEEPLRLERITLEIARGEFVAIVGPSGGGKSTLAFSVNGIVPHEIRSSETAGDVFVLDLKVSGRKPHELVRSVGTVLQDPEWQLVTFTVEDEIAFGPENLGVAPEEIRERVDRVADLLGLTDLLDRSPDELSGGQKQRVAVAACLALSPPILLLDEPLSELDPAGKDAVMGAVSSLNREHGLTVLLVEHNLDLVAPHADRLVAVAGGRIVADGPPRDVFSDPEVLRATGLKAPQPMEVASLLPPELRCERPPLSAAELAESLMARNEAVPRVVTPDEPSRPTAIGARRAVVEARGLRYRYPDGPEAVAGVDLTVREGEYVGLIGQNGAGKSTLAKLLVGLLRPGAGTVALDGRPLAGLSRREIASRIGYVFQNPDFQFFKGTCFAEVAFGLELRGLPEAEVEERAVAALSALGMEAYRDEHPHFLSRGQRRRVAIATVLAMEPEVIVLDEPTTGLDTGTAARLLDVIDALRERGHAIMMLTHEMRAVLERCDRLVLVHDGRIVLDDDPRRAFGEKEVLERCHLRPPPLAELFGGLPWSPTLLPRTGEEAGRPPRPALLGRGAGRQGWDRRRLRGVGGRTLRERGLLRCRKGAGG